MSGRDIGAENYLSSRPSPPASLHGYPLQHSQMKPTLTPYSGLYGNSGLGRPLSSDSNSSINSTRSASSALHGYSDGHGYSRPKDYSLMSRHSKGPFSSTPTYQSPLYGDHLDARKHSTRTNTSLSDHTPSSRSAHHAHTPWRNLTPSAHDKTLTPSKTDPSPPNVELQRSKLKVKRLEREVTNSHMCL